MIQAINANNQLILLLDLHQAIIGLAVVVVVATAAGAAAGLIQGINEVFERTIGGRDHGHNRGLTHSDIQLRKR